MFDTIGVAWRGRRPAFGRIEQMLHFADAAVPAMIIFTMIDVKDVSSLGPSAVACCAPTTGVDPALDADRLAELSSALSEPVRVHILDVLRRHAQPLCQCELLALFGIPQPTLSHHINKLVRGGLVNVERRHRWAYYSVSPDSLKELSTWLS